MILQEYLQKNIPFLFYPPLSLNCQINLLDNICEIQMEKNLDGVCRPDISLLDNKGNVLVAIEIVDTHTPKKKIIQYYKEHHIALYQINLRTSDDLIKIEKKSKNPNIWTTDFLYHEVGCKQFFENVKKLRETQKSIKNKHSTHYLETNEYLEKIIDENLILMYESSAYDYKQGIKGYGSYRNNKFIEAVREMRIAQKNYITTSSSNSKRLSNKREKYVDKLIDNFMKKICNEPTQLQLEL